VKLSQADGARIMWAAEKWADTAYQSGSDPKNVECAAKRKAASRALTELVSSLTESDA
jgi:hypothetical protein